MVNFWKNIDESPWFKIYKYWLLIWRDLGWKTWAGKIWFECVWITSQSYSLACFAVLCYTMLCFFSKPCCGKFYYAMLCLFSKLYVVEAEMLYHGEHTQMSTHSTVYRWCKSVCWCGVDVKLMWCWCDVDVMLMCKMWLCKRSQRTRKCLRGR